MAIKSIALITAISTVASLLSGLALPETATVERSAVIDASPEQVYELLESSAGFQSFNPYKDTDPNLDIQLHGPAKGIGSAFSFKGKEGKGTQTIIDLDPNRQVTMKIDLGARGQPIQTFTLTPVDGGTEVRWAVASSFGYNPLKRVFGLFMDRFMGGTLTRGLGNLQALHS